MAGDSVNVQNLADSADQLDHSSSEDVHSNTSNRLEIVNPPCLNSLIINCQSIKAKRVSFATVVDYNLPDIIFGCESWLSPIILNAEVLPAGYNIYRHDRQDGYGGVFIACHKHLTSHEVSYSGTDNIVTCKLKLSNNDSLLVCCVYRSPNRSADKLVDICNSLETVILSSPSDAIWIAGDLNLPVVLF